MSTNVPNLKQIGGGHRKTLVDLTWNDPGLNFISQVSCHFCNLSRSFCGKEESFCVLIGVYKMQSSKLLTHIINLSITTGSIPDDLKMARIVPLYKKNSKTHVGNYRPISVLSVISKVFEKVVFMQLSDYLSEN